MDLIERLRAVKWEVIDDGDRMPDDPAHKCVFVDMRPDEFEALLTEAAAALGAAREDAARYRLLRRKVRLTGGEFHLNLDPHYIAGDAAANLDAAIDRERRAGAWR